MMSNRSLVIVSLLLAIGFVYIKGQERIEKRPLINLQVSIENQAPNLVLPDTTQLPVVSVEVQGPGNTVSLIRSVNSLFQIDLEQVQLGQALEPVNVILAGSMLRTNLDASDRAKVQVNEESIKPRQIQLVVIPHEMGTPREPVPEVADGMSVIPLYRVEKVVPVLVPTSNEPARYRLLVDPPSIRLTGAPDALATIDSISTMEWDLTGIRPDLNTTYLSLTGLADRTDVRPVGGRILGVSATAILEEGN